MPGAPETKTALIVVRTYPTPAKKGIEVSCTAAITQQGEWLRLFPAPYRFLDPDKRFRKYQWVRASLTKASDPRPESYRLDSDSIEIISAIPAQGKWRARKEVVLPLRSRSLCELKRRRDADGHPTLGLFRPKTIKRLVISADTPDWSQGELELLRQKTLFGPAPKKDLEKVPHKFRYEFKCDDAECQGHKLLCTDWEMGESWRRWKDKYDAQWEQKFRQKYEAYMINDRDTHFYVGTIHQHPKEWIIVGLFYPPPETPLPLIDASEP